MSFTGTLDKCKACDKTVYVMDLMTLEGMPYHKSCFRCSHCKAHFEQLFKESGNFSKNFQTGKTEKSNEMTRPPSKLSSFFSGTQDKCAACKKTVYPLEKMTMEGESYHKACFRCAHSVSFFSRKVTTIMSSKPLLTTDVHLRKTKPNQTKIKKNPTEDETSDAGPEADEEHES
ncbi:hypothetical protein YC2023_078151 [Brassica napus]